METRDIALLTRAAEELAILVEQTTGYPDNPERLRQAEPTSSSVVTEIYCRLIEEGVCIPAAIANLVTHLHAPSVFTAHHGA